MNFDILNKIGTMRDAVPGSLISSSKLNYNFQHIKDIINQNVEAFKEFFLNIDDEPTDGSDNLVTSNGVYDAIEYALGTTGAVAAGESASQAAQSVASVAGVLEQVTGMKDDMIEDVNQIVEDAVAQAEAVSQAAIDQFTVDPTLTIQGVAADAKVTGDRLAGIAAAVGSPLVITDPNDFDNAVHTRVYVYAGTTTSLYTNGDWYYWDGDGWESGGVYNSVAVDTDDTLSVSGMAADAAAVGVVVDDVTDLKSAITSLPEFIVNHSIVANPKWENGLIDSTDGTDITGNDNIRTNFICTYGGKIIATRTSTEIALYAIEYDKNFNYLQYSENVYNTILPINPNCKFIRFYTYSDSISQESQDQYVLVSYVNDKSINDVLETIENVKGNSASIVAYRNMIGISNSLKDTSIFYVGTSGQTYAQSDYLIINKTFSKGDSYSFSAESIRGNKTQTPTRISIYNGNTLIRTESGALSATVTISDSDVSSGANKLRFYFYASTTTALTSDCYAENVQVFEADNRYDYSDLFYKTAFKSSIDADLIFKSDVVSIGATTNNDGGSTYIYKDLVTIPVNNESIYVSVEKVINNLSVTCIRMYEYDQSGTEIKYTGFREGQFFLIPTATTKSVLVRLYPSTTGGLTQNTADFHNIKILKSTDGTAKPISNPYNDEIPHYYMVNNYLEDKIADIREAMHDANANYDTFIFCTDQHWTLNAKQSPKLIEYVSKRLGIKRLILGGDLADGVEYDAYKYYRDHFDGEIDFVVGNHEYFNYITENARTTSGTVNRNVIYEAYNSHDDKYVFGNTGAGYYYSDNPATKTRYVILSTFAKSGNVAGTEFDSTQQSWLENVALDLPQGYTAIIIGHFLAEVSSEGVATLSSAGEIVTEIAEEKNVACIFAGHTHRDGLISSGDVPLFVTTSDKYAPYMVNGEPFEPWLVETRTYGTTTEQAFDVVVVDKYNKKVTAVRIGYSEETSGLRYATYTGQTV